MHDAPIGSAGRADAAPPVLDETDRRVLSQLSSNARASARAIARELGVSVGMVLDRIERLERQRVILGYRVEVNHAAAGFGVNAFVRMKMAGDADVDATLDHLMTIDEIEVVNWTTGEYEVYATVRARDQHHLRQVLLGKLRRVPGCERMETAVGLAHRRREGGLYALTWKDEGS